MKKILIIMLCFVLSCGFVLANDESTKVKIESIKYSGNLQSNTEISIQGKNLESCNKIKYEGKTLKSKNDKNYVRFLYSEINVNTGVIEINCKDEIIKYLFEFPYIKSVDISSINRDSKLININGNNFGKSNSVTIPGGSFSIQSQSNNTIFGNLPVTINKNEIYVTTDGLKSNVFKFDIDLPKIDLITSQNGFKTKDTIFLHGNNLNKFKNSVIKFGEEEIYSFKEGKGNINFEVNNKIGDFEIQVISNGFESNKITINLKGSKPEITQIDEKENKLYIYADNLTDELNKLDLYNNGSKLQISTLKSDHLVLENYKLNHGNNFFQLLINKNKSNVFNYKKKLDLPYLSSMNILGVDDGKRTIKLYINNFNENIDKIYLDNSILSPAGCIGNMCRILVNESKLKGKISVGKDNLKNGIYKKFDIEYDSTPFFEYVKIPSEIKQGSKITFNGDGFIDGKLTTTNLFPISTKNKTKADIGNSNIEGRLDYGFEKNKDSKITISKLGKTVSYTLNLEENLGKKVYFPAKIKEIKSNKGNEFVKAGELVTVFGRGFKNEDVIVIGDYEIPLFDISYSKGSFIIPKNIKPNEYSYYLRNKKGFKSETNKISILDSDFNNSINLNGKDVTKNSFYVGDDINDNLYEIEIDNNISDAVVNEISFNIEANISKLGLFELYLGGTKIGSSLVSEDGVLNFTDKFILEKKHSGNNLVLKKKGGFNNSGKLSISLNKENLDLNYIKLYKMKVEYNFRNLNKNEFNIREKEEINCYDSIHTNINCNNFINGKYNKTKTIIEDKKTEKAETTKKTTIEEKKIINKVKTGKKVLFVKRLILSKENLIKSSNGSKYKKQIDEIGEKLNDEKLIKLFKKIENISTGKSKHKDILEYLISRVGVELHIRDLVEK